MRSDRPYSGYLIGGPCHGERWDHTHSQLNLMEPQPLDDGPITHENACREIPLACKYHTYLHSEEYTEWGNIVRVFIWQQAGSLGRFDREKFIRAALTGDGKVRAVTKANQKIIWPECPDDWYEMSF